MPRRNNGRRKDTKTYKELRKAVKNFNAKVKRLEEKGYTHIPYKLSYKEIKENVRNINDLRTEIKEINKFNKRGGELPTVTDGNVTISKWVYDRAKRKLDIINEQRTKIVQDYKNKYGTVVMRNMGGGIKEPYTEIPTRAREAMDKYTPIKMPKKVVNENAYKFVERRYGVDYYDVNTKAEQYKSNYLDAYKSFYGKVPQNLYREGLNLIKSFTAEQLQDIYMRSDVDENLFNIEYLYNEPIDIVAKLRELIEEMKDAKNSISTSVQ